ncbi:branched-chain amino acid ABC transporter permease [Ferrimicrobium acidiphilum]|jgi:branched-chain amino acid transport system permease protein|uniref:branched-chain amino acid ABC transporter permease n=1 Tax=Ferrimicrobium acidiphilum TaxID=121039 RepID=UPI0023F06CDA|nr:branched-chain amino acid ABC transporter permease [Ferrimicrobium acidiphilum]MCL5052950.1 branched-chain amino acid ABC transporter permease [Gammaproteobacteria bacterium]
MLFEYSVIGGILLGLFYALMAMGLNLVFGVQRIINLAHGDIIMLGGFAAWELYYSFHVNPIVSVIIVIPFSVALGFILYYVLIPRLKSAKDFETLSLVLFFGVSQVTEALAALGFGNNQRTMPSNSLPSAPIHLFGQSYQSDWFIAAGVAIPILLLFFLYLYRTKLGRQTRAVMADTDEAASVGIDATRVSAITFGVGLALAAVSGVMAIFVFSGVQASEGVGLTVIAFAIIVFGSLGNPMGTVLAGLLFGVFYQLAQVYLPSWSDLVPYVLVLGTMLIRPQGLLGRRTRVV